MQTMFTAYRFTKRNSDCAMMFIALSDAGFSPVWADEAPSKRNPDAKRALLINLPKGEAERFRAWHVD